jgi:hypothetical protein
MTDAQTTPAASKANSKAPVDPKAAAKAAKAAKPKAEKPAKEAKPAKEKAAAPKKEAKAKAEKPAKATKEKTEKPAKEAKAKAPAKEKAPAKKVELDVFGFRKGSKKSQAAKLYSVKKGATLAEVKEATGSSQLNLLKELEEKGHTVEKEKVAGPGKKQVTRYKIVAQEKAAK